MWIYDVCRRSDKSGNSEIYEKVKVDDTTVEITAYREGSKETI
jgi:hypothetical protein